jgi:hypothetical protein
VVLPAATLARFEKNYLSLYTDISADVCRLVGAVGSVLKMKPIYKWYAV